MGELIVGCSGWNYPDPPPDGWLGVFYPRKDIRMLKYYSRFFNTAEMDATFYEKFYSQMARETFLGLVKATPDNFQFSVKVPETITHKKRLDMTKGVTHDLTEFLYKISPLKFSNKLATILIQLPPSFTVKEFRKTEKFLDALPKGYDYALEFRHESWKTEGPWEMLKHYNIAAVITDCPDEELQYLAEPAVTADHAFIRWHGRNNGFWYDYLYSKEELKPWVEKVTAIREQTRITRGYFNNHLGGKAVLNALQFRSMTGKITEEERRTMREVEDYLAGKAGMQKWM